MLGTTVQVFCVFSVDDAMRAVADARVGTDGAQAALVVISESARCGGAEAERADELASEAAIAWAESGCD